MWRKIVTIIFVGASACFAIDKLREIPAVSSLFLTDVDSASLGFQWPPKVGSEYPDLELLDHTGKTVQLSDFKGKVILVELIGTPCGACQAYSGAHDAGVFNDGKVQSNLESIETYAGRFGHFNLNDRRVVFVQILLFNKKMQSPTLEEARDWAEHFGMDRKPNRHVLVGTSELASRQSFKMIPGFHLIDRKFVLRSDSSGHQPLDNLYTKLLPKMGKLVANRH